MQESEFFTWENSIVGQEPQKLYIYIYIVCQTRRWPNIMRSLVDWLTYIELCPYSNEANAQNPLKFAGVPQTRKPFSAASGPKLTILWGHLEEILLFNKYFRLPTHALVANIFYSPTKLSYPVFSASHVQHILEMHFQFTQRPHHMWMYGRHPICDRWE